LRGTQGKKRYAILSKPFNVDVDLQCLVDAPTVAEMSVYITKCLVAGMEPHERDLLLKNQKEEKSDRNTEWSYLVPIQPGSHRPIFVCPGGVGGGGGEFFVYARLAHHVGPAYPFYGLRPRSADGKEASHATIEEMARDYLAEIRSLQAEGPYTVLGECGGGLIAYEIAQQLRS